MKRVALIVGINRYPFLREHLTTPARDADAIARFLELYGSFQVKRLPTGQDDWQFEPSQVVKAAELKNAITQLFQPQNTPIPDTALLFFAGNGLRREDNGKTEGFLATSESTPRKNLWGVSLQWLRHLLQESAIPQQIVWLDCSYSGELFNFTESATGNQKRDQCFITACQATEIAHARNGRGILTNFLLQGINPKKSPQERTTNYGLENVIPSQVEIENHLQHPIVDNREKPIFLTGQNGIPEWLVIRQHPLERLWNETEDWFFSQIPQEAPLINIHEASLAAELFHKDTAKAKQYQETLEQVFGMSFPSTWWENPDSVKNIHESLKCLCGDVFCGTTDDPLRKRSLSVSAAYFVAMMAHQEIWGDITPLTQKVSTWADYSQVTSKLFPWQPPSVARASTIALYDFFSFLFTDRDRKGYSPVMGTLLKKPGNRLEIQFHWNANRESHPLATGESLAQSLTNSINSPNFTIPEVAQNTKSAIIQLWKYMLASEKGFMSPGVIYMEKDIIIITSVQ